MTAMERLTVWTTLAALALAFTCWLVWDNWWNYRAVQRAIREGRLPPHGAHWWIALTELVASVVTVGAWAAFVVVGILGFFPLLFEYRSWGQLVAVLLLMAVQGWRLVARKRAQWAPVP